MQLSSTSKVVGPAALIALITLVMLGAMAFAVPPARIEVATVGVERGYLVSHSRFSPILATNVAAAGYTYLAIDLTNAETGEAAHWSEQLDRVNEVQFPVWGWIELDSAFEQEAVRLAQIAIVTHASLKTRLAQLDDPNSLAASTARSTAEALVKDEEKLTGDKAKQRVDELLKEQRTKLAGEELEAGRNAEQAKIAAKRAGAEWKLKELVPSLNLRGLFVVGEGAVARAHRFAADNPSFKVMPVVGAGGEMPEGRHAVAFGADAFVEGAKAAGLPILAAAGIGLERVEALRGQVEGNYLVATVAVAR